MNGETLTMPENFGEAIAASVRELKSDRQLIGAVVISIILVSSPNLYVISTVQKNHIAILLAIVWCATITLALCFVPAALILLKFRKRGKRTFIAEHREEFQKQLQDSQEFLISLRGYIVPVEQNLNILVQQGKIQLSDSTQLVSPLNTLRDRIREQEEELNERIGRFASIQSMNVPKAVSLRKTRWEKRKTKEF